MPEFIPLAYKTPGVHMTIGGRLRKARKEAGLSQKELAKRMGWESESQSRISQYEKDKREPTLGDIAKLAKITGADPGQLAFGERELSKEEEGILQAFRNASEEGRSFILSACDASKARGVARRRRRGD